MKAKDEKDPSVEHPAPEKTSSDDRPADQFDENRRTFLKVAMTLSAIFAFGGVATVLRAITNPSAAATGLTSFPKVQVANIADLQVNRPVYFNYPLDTEPNILVKLGQKADGGVGPDGDIVAFSQFCQHLGCPYSFIPTGSSPVCDPSYKASGPIGYCCCHGGVYDFAHSAKVAAGPPPNPVPQVALSVNGSGNIFAVGMTAPAIYGHNQGSDYISSDLQGGNLVG